MDGQQAMPNPVEGELWLPQEWITTTGAVKWTKGTPVAKCEDCLHCIVDALKHRPTVLRTPGVARTARHTRTQGGEKHHFCHGHHQLRLTKEKTNG